MLTDKQCKNASCDAGRPRVRLADSGGLYLEVSPSGSKRWFWKYRFDGKEKRLALGGYPDLGLKEARVARDDARKQHQSGADPVLTRQVDAMRSHGIPPDRYLLTNVTLASLLGIPLALLIDRLAWGPVSTVAIMSP